MKVSFGKDLKAIREILGITQVELAEQLRIDQKTISRNENDQNEPTTKLLEQVYSFAFEKKIRINKLKEMLWIDNMNKNHKLLFHRAKSEIEGDLSVRFGSSNNDFGQGFLCRRKL